MQVQECSQRVFKNCQVYPVGDAADGLGNSRPLASEYRPKLCLIIILDTYLREYAFLPLHLLICLHSADMCKADVTTAFVMHMCAYRAGACVKRVSRLAQKRCLQ